MVEPIVASRAISMLRPSASHIAGSSHGFCQLYSVNPSNS